MQSVHAHPDKDHQGARCADATALRRHALPPCGLHGCIPWWQSPSWSIVRTCRSDADSCGRTVGETRSARSLLELGAAALRSHSCRTLLRWGTAASSSRGAAAPAWAVPAIAFVMLAMIAAVPTATKSRRRQDGLAGCAELGSDELLLALHLRQALTRHLRANMPVSSLGGKGRCPSMPGQSSQQRARGGIHPAGSAAALVVPHDSADVRTDGNCRAALSGAGRAR